MTQEQEDILRKNDSVLYKTKMECQKVKCKADCNKNWANSIKYVSCTSCIF